MNSRYTFISEDINHGDLDACMERVERVASKLMLDGWTPAGGPVILENSHQAAMVQAMYKANEVAEKCSKGTTSVGPAKVTLYAKPCPCCGSDDLTLYEREFHVFVCCNNCDNRGPGANRESNVAREDCILDWNDLHKLKETARKGNAS